MTTSSAYMTLNRPSYLCLKDTLTVTRRAYAKDSSGGNLWGADAGSPAETTVLSALGVVYISRASAVEVVATLHGEQPKGVGWILNPGQTAILPQDICTDADGRRFVVIEVRQAGNLTKMDLREES